MVPERYWLAIPWHFPLLSILLPLLSPRYYRHNPANPEVMPSMRIAKTESHVDPQKQFAYIVVWTVFNLLGVLGFLILLVVGLLSRRLRQNPILISFYANFAVACFGNAFLSVSGYVFKEVPYGICVVSGAFGVSVSLLQTTAALALVLKVSSTFYLLAPLQLSLIVLPLRSGHMR
jgi:hypothetical protein